MSQKQSEIRRFVNDLNREFTRLVNQEIVIDHSGQALRILQDAEIYALTRLAERLLKESDNA